MGQIIIGDGGKPSRIQELVMGLHRSDQEENVRRIEAVVADLVREGVAGEGEAAGAAVRSALAEVEHKIAEAETQVNLLRAALEEAGNLATAQQAKIVDLEVERNGFRAEAEQARADLAAAQARVAELETTVAEINAKVDALDPADRKFVQEPLVKAVVSEPIGGGQALPATLEGEPQS